ncbi:GTP pyrophosphokinase [Paucilactobacillus hokkaidonensis JCM 18461]|uniref:GTP pyrophosphokinase n=2 Tax=Paucilactobacillus hokkaidonensis TaxID=1193095 RepID=A0A0A1GRZ3_9LACO|nr:GTP pyrophosphokinase [Paucilactobacillus hokkaidonensis]KRO09862.1 RelA SpoT domain-containing protein [Paucilactobacillus hokkaidonensis]BAP84750.1 GTP pyrophosphokinase [Paucilactobacillus hokkaidonensis JCM 18461]
MNSPRPNFFNLNKALESFQEISGQQDLHGLERFANYYHLCYEGSNEISTKLENLDSEFQFKYSHNPIHHMENRMKEVSSLKRKVESKGLPVNIDSIEGNIFDIAGIRVVTNYLNDVYYIEKTLLQQSDVTLIKRKDYIKNPKESGYRSLHLVVSVPVFQSDGVQSAPVEVQIRTEGMDMWASLEHKLRYKTKTDPQLIEKYSPDLKSYASELADIEKHMQEIHQALS